MEIIIKPPGGGEITQLIEWAKADSRRMLIVHSTRRKEQIKKAHPELKGRVLAWGGFRNGKVIKRNITEVAIENADLILQAEVGTTIAKILMSEDV